MFCHVRESAAVLETMRRHASVTKTRVQFGHNGPTGQNAAPPVVVGPGSKCENVSFLT